MRPNKFNKQVTFNISEISESEREPPHVARKRNSGFSSLLPNTPLLTRQTSSSNEVSNSDEQTPQQGPKHNKNIKEVEPTNSSGSDGLASIDEYSWNETKLRQKNLQFPLGR